EQAGCPLGPDQIAEVRRLIPGLVRLQQLASGSGRCPERCVQLDRLIRSSARVTIPAKTSSSPARRPTYQSVSRTRIVSPMARLTRETGSRSPGSFRYGVGQPPPHHRPPPPGDAAAGG